MSVYFIEAPELARIKIGFSGNARKRFAKICSDSPVDLVLRAVIDGDKSLEQEWHRRFANFQIKGEWFDHSGALAVAVADLPSFEEVKRPRSLNALIVEAAGIGPSYASMIATGVRKPPLELAIHLYRRIGWRHASLEGIPDAALESLGDKLPWKRAA